ncbi:TetR family transcriptional regulator [Cytobacillus firmus]|uniref:TetR family transcriptional regulator n=2 Tax=Cytobacillus TaxID=2675230 RepID=A0A366JC40_CYTFI|nr:MULTISPECIES: TetR/AcrR family transcriptional regulator [Cytobacillus]RBP84533.1 TetR family transcriptional regulator [Cytobacillus firmus]TDX34782.1 TetR family transcriptional regulator [Cytobacillus oceanisediminis]
MNNSLNIPKKQKLTKKGQETRSRIIVAAAELMYEQGVARTTIEDVQNKAKISASQMYHYFKEKKELVLEVISYQTSRVIGTHTRYLSNLDSFEALYAWRDFIVNIQIKRNCEGGCPLGSLASELVEINSDAQQEIMSSFFEWEDSIKKGLRYMLNHGELNSDADPDKLALALLAALQGGLLLTQVRRDPTPIIVALDTMIEHIISFKKV